MGRKAIFVALVIFWGLTGAASPSLQASDQVEAPVLYNLGSHQFKITTSSTLAQRYFNQGLILVYGFNNAEAIRSFRYAAKLDPGCAMVYWGIALALAPNVNHGIRDSDVPKAYRAVQRALALSGKVSAKEQALIKAMALRHTPRPVKDRASINMVYAQAMRGVYQRFPRDSEVATLLAEALMVLHPWDFWNKDGSLKPWTPEIWALLEKALALDPNNPGANHFYIHAVEGSAQPQRALAAAKRLRYLVPDLGHLVHMPSHIYLRMGNYQEVVKSNQKAIKADQAYLAKPHAKGNYRDMYSLHNYHFLICGLFMEGRSKEALAAAQKTRDMVDRKQMRQPDYGTGQHFYSQLYYTLIRFGRWDLVLKMHAPDAHLGYPRGIWHFARGLAFLRKGRHALAQKELRRLAALAEDRSLDKVTIWDLNTCRSLLQIAKEVLAGELAAGKKRYDAAVTHLNKAVRLEEALNYDEPPPWYLPVRHCLGAVLLAAGRPGQAEKVFRRDLMIHPHNGWALYGLFQSLLAQGKKQAALQVQARFNRAWGRADVRLNGSWL